MDDSPALEYIRYKNSLYYSSRAYTVLSGSAIATTLGYAITRTDKVCAIKCASLDEAYTLHDLFTEQGSHPWFIFSVNGIYAVWTHVNGQQTDDADILHALEV